MRLLCGRGVRRLDQDPNKMTLRRQTAEHPFGTIKDWMGATHFLMRGRHKVATEMALNVLSNLLAIALDNPDALAALAYDATNLMLQGIKEAGADDPTKVKDALAKISFDAVSGKITFVAQHNPVKSATILAVTPDGVKFNSVVNP